MDDLLVDFLTETNESLAEADLALVRLEQEPQDGATLSLIFRLVHTIKGTCGFLGLPRLERVAHAAENVLGRVRDGILPVTPDLVSAVLTALDQIKTIVGALAATGQEPAGEDVALIGHLNALSESKVGDAGPAVAVVAVVPTPVLMQPEPGEPVTAAVAPAEVTPGDATVGGQTIRVGVDVLEGLMTLVSELVLTRNQLLQLARTQDNARFTGPLQRLSHITSDLQEGVMKTRMQPIGHAWNKLPRLVRDLARELDKKIDLVMLGAETELDRQVLELIKDPLTHMVRNSGDHGLEKPAQRRAAGKPETGRITLKAYHEGGHIVIEIGDDGRGLPIDLIKAKVVSKGLATEAELAAMSGEAIQRFIFRAGFSTASAITAVSGRGVGMDVVKTNIERIGGTIELKSRGGEGTVFTIKIPLTLAIVAALIVQAGEERFAIPQLSVVELVQARESRVGDGRPGRTLNGVGSADPSVSSQVERINGTPVLRLRERLLPLVSLERLLKLRNPLDEPANALGDRLSGSAGVPDESLTIIVAQVGASQLGLIVDRVFDTEEIVVKPVSPVLRHISMFSGNTILGDGSVIMILDPNGIARATGIGTSDGRAAAAEPPAAPVHEMARTAMLLFKAGVQDIKAVPLSLVARLENIPKDRVETAGGAPVTQYRGRLMRLVPVAGQIDPERAQHAVLVFTDEGQGPGQDRCMGLVVDEIVDVVDEHLQIELSGARDGILGTAITAGRATDVIDTAFWLTLARPDWFENAGGGDRRQARRRLLVVEDSDFFRQMIVPVLQAGGYEVASVQSAAQALHLRDSGVMFDAVVSDIEMPDMSGIEFVRAVRAGGPWAELPVIALSGRVGEQDIESGREAGFTDYVGKFAKDALLGSLRECLGQPRPAADRVLRMVA